jgi:hypothetical protein
MDAIAKTNLGSSENMQLFQNTTDLYKAEDYIRKYFIPWAMCEYKLAIGELEDVDDNVIDLYLLIQEHANDNEGTGFKTKETKFSFDDAKKLYNFLAVAFDAGLEAFQALFMNLPRRQQDMYNFRDRKKREHKVGPYLKKKCKHWLIKQDISVFQISFLFFAVRNTNSALSALTNLESKLIALSLRHKASSLASDVNSTKLLQFTNGLHWILNSRASLS